MAKPTVVLVPGAWCPPEIYADVVKHLSSHGYTAKVIALPSVGAEPAKPDATADVEAIRSHLRQLIEVEGQDVVLGLHSYASLPGNNAAEGFSKKEREEKGLKGGIVRFVLLASHPGNEGHSLWASDAVPPEWMKVDVEKGTVSIGPEDAKNLFFHDLPSELGDEWARKLRHHSMGVFSSIMTYAAWKHIPSTFVRADGDRGYFSPAVVDQLLQASREVEPTAFDVEERTDAGHLLMVSRPEWLGQVLRRAAGENV